jgi:hypothetical protein
MAKYRESRHDAPARKPVAERPPTYVPILDQLGNHRGHVHGLNAPTVPERFGVHNAQLKKVDGRTVWQGTAGPTSGRGSAKLAKQLTAAKGSVTKRPTKPALAVRPERGG